MKKVMFSLFFIVLLATCATAQKTPQFSQENALEVTGTIKYYGERAGLIRPCKGTCVLVCKEISQIQTAETKNSIKGNITKKEYVIISDGKNKMVIEKFRVNFKDGSVK